METKNINPLAAKVKKTDAHCDGEKNQTSIIVSQ